MQTGSTEWVEENREMLSSRAVAYLNVDVSVVGPVFHPSATPQLDELFQETMKLVSTSFLKTSHVDIFWGKRRKKMAELYCLFFWFYCRNSQ